MDLIPGLGRSPGGGHGNPHQYSYLENPHGQRRLASCSSWDCKELDMTERLSWRRKWQPTPVFLPGESQGRGSLVGCRLWGRTESDTTEATYHLAVADKLVLMYSIINIDNSSVTLTPWKESYDQPR